MMTMDGSQSRLFSNRLFPRGLVLGALVLIGGSCQSTQDDDRDPPITDPPTVVIIEHTPPDGDDPIVLTVETSRNAEGNWTLRSELHGRSEVVYRAKVLENERVLTKTQYYVLDDEDLDQLSRDGEHDLHLTGLEWFHSDDFSFRIRVVNKPGTELSQVSEHTYQPDA